MDINKISWAIVYRILAGERVRIKHEYSEEILSRLEEEISLEYINIEHDDDNYLYLRRNDG